MTHIVAGRNGVESASASMEQFGYRQERCLGLLDLTVYGLIFMVKTAPMNIFGFVYNTSHGMVPLVYAVGFVAMVFTALSYVTMSQTVATAGSVSSSIKMRSFRCPNRY